MMGKVAQHTRRVPAGKPPPPSPPLAFLDFLGTATSLLPGSPHLPIGFSKSLSGGRSLRGTAGAKAKAKLCRARLKLGRASPPASPPPRCQRLALPAPPTEENPPAHLSRLAPCWKGGRLGSVERPFPKGNKRPIAVTRRLGLDPPGRVSLPRPSLVLGRLFTSVCSAKGLGRCAWGWREWIRTWGRYSFSKTVGLGNHGIMTRLRMI